MKLLVFCALAMPWALVIALAAAVIWLRRVVVAVARMIAAWIRLLAHEVRGRQIAVRAVMGRDCGT